MYVWVNLNCILYFSERTMFILPPEPTGLPEGKQYRYVSSVNINHLIVSNPI